MASYDAADKIRFAHADARNSLESYIYKMQDFFDSSKVTTATDETERQGMLDKLREASEWLDSVSDATTQHLVDQLAALKAQGKTMLDHVLGRDAVQEGYGRTTRALDGMQTAMKDVASKMTSRFTGHVHDEEETEIQTLQTDVDALQKWVLDARSAFEQGDPKLEKDLAAAKEEAGAVAGLKTQLEEANSAHEATKSQLTTAQEEASGHQSKTKELEEQLESAKAHEAKVAELEAKVKDLQAVEVRFSLPDSHRVSSAHLLTNL